MAGAWLPLCSSTLLGCAPGHFALEGAEPSLSCSAKGVFGDVRARFFAHSAVSWR